MMLKEYKMDLHIHTCLSPCAEKEMLPTAIIKRAKEEKIDAIAICDHNSAQNVSAVRKAGQKENVNVLRGMEICTSEEVHVLALFNDDDALVEMQKIVYENLTGENDEKYFGDQTIVDQDDRVTGSTKKLLIGATSLGINRVAELIHNLGGIAVASHVDRDSFSIIAQLGFIPEQLSLDALDLSWRCTSDDVKNYEKYNLPLVKSSDAHFLSDIGKAFTKFCLQQPSFSEIALAFQGYEGRAVKI